MKPEEKDLLLKDLCARLPYGVKANSRDGKKTITITPIGIANFMSGAIYIIKPYLRPLSSMTEEEKVKLSLSQIYAFAHYNEIAKIDWLNAHHFDYRGLIDKGLAIEVTEENNPYKD